MEPEIHTTIGESVRYDLIEGISSVTYAISSRTSSPKLRTEASPNLLALTVQP